MKQQGWGRKHLEKTLKEKKTSSRFSNFVLSISKECAASDVVMTSLLKIRMAKWRNSSMCCAFCHMLTPSFTHIFFRTLFAHLANDRNLSKTGNPEECGGKAKCPTTTIGRQNRLGVVENVINERNMMPEIPNYSLKENGDFSLNRKRHISSIPKNNSEYWLYPSSQQFYNSLMRKNKDIDKNYIDAVVSIHNEVNEESWKQILKYEYMHKKKCNHVTLQRFLGKFDDLSLKAKIRSTFSGYKGEARLARLTNLDDHLTDTTATSREYPNGSKRENNAIRRVQIYIDVRPAMDSLSNVWDREAQNYVVAIKQCGENAEERIN
ncbi:cytochrome c heme lyase, putative [Plasmodium ovale curtisi]|uniref:Holocytochrome c-type synthase n=1 Tax=Plasmodium ovale curtisi TaxID=864141 RepID=A0A1A8X175_PLAOA|nr:cytochrome c heme lyase, putative [Plasmodium ovale curtisi]SBS98361.1 cytochrome c heme lyase, putative [Plasmodium ovale curtisi]